MARGVVLDPVMKMRVQLWLEALSRESGHEVADLQNVPVLAELSSLEFPLYRQGRRAPSVTTLKLLDQVFPGAREVFDRGPDGIPLWPILDGDTAACREVVASAFKQLEVADASVLRLDQKVSRLWTALLPDHLHYFKTSEELLTSRTWNIFAATYEAAFRADTREEWAESQVRGRVYPPLQIGACVALWKLCVKADDAHEIARSSYIVAGMCARAIHDEFPEAISTQLAAFLLEEIASSGGWTPCAG